MQWLHTTTHTATPPQQQPPTGSNNPKWKQKFQNQRSMKPTLIQPPSKPTNHHNNSSSGHQPQNQTWKHQTQPTKTQHQWPSPLKPITDDPPHHREGHRHSDLTTTHPTIDLITDLHHKRGSGRRSVPSLRSTFTSGTLMPKGWRRWLVAPVGEWLQSGGGTAVGLRRSVGGATRFWERRFRLRRRQNWEGEKR